MHLTLTRWKVFLIVFLIWSGIYLPSLGGPEFKGEEGRRVLPAVTMLQTGNWVVPSVGGEDYYNKPPGINWLVAISFIITRQHSELAARLPSALFVLAFVSLLIWMPGSWLSLSGRLISAIIFLTNISSIEKGRLIEIEAVYISLTGLAVLWWLNVWSGGGSRWSLWLLPAFVLGFGLLVKGPAILLFFYCTVTAVLIYARRFKELFTVQHILAVIITLTMPIVWLYLAYQQTTGAKMTAQFISQFLSHSASGDLDLSYWARNVVKAFGLFLPWLLFVPILWKETLTSRIDPKQTNLFKGCRLGLIISFAFTNLMPGALSRYSLPAFPLAGILLGWVLSLHKEFAASDRIWKNTLLGFFCLLSLSAVAGLIAVTKSPIAVVVSALTICITIIIFLKRTAFQNVLQLCLATALLTVVIMLQYAVFGVSIINKHEKFRPAAYCVNKTVPAEQTVYVFKPGYQAFLFYVRPPLKYVLSTDEIDRNVQYLLLEKRYLDKLKTQPNVSSRSVEILHKFTDRIKGQYRLVRLE